MLWALGSPDFLLDVSISAICAIRVHPKMIMVRTYNLHSLDITDNGKKGSNLEGR
jgi:hypothetical protein